MKFFRKILRRFGYCKLHYDIYTVAEFKEYCQQGLFIDYGGFGYPIKDSKAYRTIIIKPSRLEEIPEDTTHIVWYNR